MSRRDNNKIWKLILHVACFLAGVLVVLGVSLFLFINFYLSPSRLTKIIEEKSSEYLDAEVKLGSLDYSIFHSFPWCHIEIDSIMIISKSLNSLPKDLRRTLPLFADSLASVEKIEVDIDLKSLIKKEIKIKDIFIDHLSLNMVIASKEYNNFSILHDFNNKIKIPEISLDDLTFLPPLNINFCSLPDSADFHVSINQLNFKNPSDGYYDFNIMALINGHFGPFSLPDFTEARIFASSKMGYPQVEVKIDSVFIASRYLEIEGKAKLSTRKSDFTIDSASIRMSTPDLLSLINKLPDCILKKINIPDYISGTIPIYADYLLLNTFESKYKDLKNFSLNNLPPSLIKIGINKGNLKITPPGEKALVADDIFLDANCRLNPQNPETSEIKLNELRLSGEGISLQANGVVDKILSESSSLNGNIYFDTALMKTLSYLFPTGGVNVNGHLKGNVRFAAEANLESTDRIRNIGINGKILSHNLKVKEVNRNEDINITGLSALYNVFFPVYPLQNYNGAILNVDLKADSVRMVDRSDLQLSLGGINLNLAVTDTLSESNVVYSLSLLTKNIKIYEEGVEAGAKDIGAVINGHLNNASSQPNSSQSIATVTGIENEEIKNPHTPFELTYPYGGMLQTIMSITDFDLSLSLGEGFCSIPSYLYPFEYREMKFHTNMNDIQASAKNITIGRTSFGFDLNADGIGDFITSGKPSLLKTRADINFNDVDINQLAWGYYGAEVKNGDDSVFSISPLKPFSSSDSICVVIPRNIDAMLRLRSQKAQYMEYVFSPLKTDIIVKDGNATLNHLTVGAPYANVIVDWTYSTQNLDNIFMTLNAKIDQFRLHPFYNVFPQLTRKVSELENLSGEISANIDCSFLLYPTMFLNAPSLKARFALDAKKMQFIRKGKIEHITHLMLIEGDEPILIDNIAISGAVHDNLLQVNPFKIKFDDYELSFGGINNMTGDLYYHLALEKSPFHLPFGVNLEGTFNHPEIRLGGTGFDEKTAEKITSQFEWNPSVNIMASLKHGWLLFVGEAAKYGQKHEK